MKSPILNHIHSFIWERVEHDGSIRRKKLINILAVGFHIKKSKSNIIIRELKRHGIILEENKIKFIIKKAAT